MTYVITDSCIDVKDKSCMEECPVSCIFDAGNMMVIDPQECIDCGACEPACPVDAIYFIKDLPKDKEKFVDINRDFFRE